MDKALTVIIPAYNVSRYIEQGMDSLLAEESVITYLDIIIVNDGSKDATLEKAQRYCKLYPESISVIDKKNGGHGSGINEGIKAAKGKYLKVLDGDDWVNSNGLRELIVYINESESYADAIISPFEKVWENGKKDIIHFDNMVLREKVTFKEVNEKRYTLSLHSLTIRSGIYKENRIPSIDENISYDDMEYILYPVPYINSIVFLGSVVYKYQLGIQGQSMDPEQMLRKLPMHTKVIESLARYYRENSDIFNDEQKIYYNQEFVDTLATNCEIRIRTKQQYETIKEYINCYSDFEISATKSKSLEAIYRFGKMGYLLVRVYKLIKR